MVRAPSNEVMYQTRGAIMLCDFILHGDVDGIVKSLLGLTEDPPTPPPDYMREEDPNG